MKRFFLIRLIVFIGVICFLKSQNKQNIQFDGINNTTLNINDEMEILQLTIILSKIPAYTKIFIEGKDDINYVISAFSDEKREERIQLAQSFYKTSSLFLSQNQVKSNSFYVDIECSSNPCTYKVTIIPTEKICLQEGQQLYYYVTEENINMEFQINLRSEKANIWSRGSRDIKNTLSNFYVDSRNKNNFIIPNSNKNVEFKVIGTIGDLINIGSNGYIEEKSNKEIFVDEETMTVFLTKNLFPKACFDFRTRNNISERYYVFLEGIIEKSILKMEIIKDGQEVEKEDELYIDGKISHLFFTNELNATEICFTFPDEESNPQYKDIEEITFNYHLTLGKNFTKGMIFDEPLLFGKLYPGSLRTGQATAFIGMKPLKDYKEINYNLFNKQGNSKLFIYDCDNYPLCLHKDNTTKNEVIPRNIDRFSTYSIYKNDLKTEFNPISKNQKLLFVYCQNSGKYYCDFDTLIFTNEDKINIYENHYFNQYLLKEEKDFFKINFAGESNIIKVNIDIIIYVGDINIITPLFDENKYNIQHFANKYIINIILGKNSDKIEEILFSVQAKKNCYYTILTRFIRDNIDLENINEYSSGKSYLLTINPQEKEGNETKIIRVKNTISLGIFMVNFLSLNCQFEIYKKIIKNNNIVFENIDKFDYYSEDTISDIIDSRSDDEYFEYKIEVQEEDPSLYNGKLCMLYISSVNQIDKHSTSSQDIIIPENTVQQIRFNIKKKHISYAYIHVNNKEDLIVKFNCIHTAEYTIKLFFEYDEGKNYIINSNRIIYLNHEEWKNQCPEKDQLCYIIIDITLNRIKRVEEPLLELSVQSVNSNANIYVPKNILKNDYLIKVPQYYYTELGEKESGYISVDFYKNNGIFSAKLFPKNLGFIDYDNNNVNALPYDKLKNIITFNTKDFQCNDGCYLLISIQENIKKSFNDEFKISRVNTDFYINIGNDKPNTTTYDFKILTEEKESANIIKKNDIINKMKEKGIEKDNIKDIYLTIGIFNNKFDSIYSFMINFEQDIQTIINRVNSEKQYLCKTVKFNENGTDYYRCLYLIENNYLINESNNLFIYPIIKDKSASYQIYGKYIDSSAFEMDSEIEVPSNSSEFSTERTKTNFLCIKNDLNNNKHLLINIVSNKDTIIKFISTFENNLNTINGNTFFPQLFFVNNNESLILDFPNEKKLMINLFSITGKAEIYWEDAKTNKYYLVQEDKQLSLTSLNDKNGKLIINSTNNNNENDVGFAFYLTYNEKHPYNFDELFLGQSINYVYTEDDLPIMFYSRIRDLDINFEIFFTFYEMENKNSELTYIGHPIEGKILLLKEEKIDEIKIFPDIYNDFSKAIKFIYNPSLKTGFINLTKEQLKNFNININDKPYLFIKLEKLNNEKVYKSLNIQVTINGENILNPLSEGIYHYGVLSEKEIKKEYPLKTLLKHNYLLFEFSSDNDAVTFIIQDELNDTLKKISSKNKNGKNIYFYNINSQKVQYLKLIISKKESDKFTVNFTFKYVNLKGINDYPEYIIENDEINVNIDNSNNKKNYKINFNPVKSSTNFKVDYIIKFGKKANNQIPKQSIAIIEEENIKIKEFKNPSMINGKLEFNFNDIEDIYTYVHVMAKITDKEKNEFLSYKYYELPKEKPNITPSESGNSYAIIFIIISIVLLLIIITLIILLYKSNKKNKNLLEEVNKTNFNVKEGLIGSGDEMKELVE